MTPFKLSMLLMSILSPRHVEITPHKRARCSLEVEHLMRASLEMIALPISQHLEEMDEYTCDAGVRCFETRKDTPIKKWLSPWTCLLIRQIAPLSRERFTAFGAVRRACLAVALHGWAFAVSCIFQSYSQSSYPVIIRSRQQ